MTPAITLLKKKRIAHDVLKYEHDSNAPSYGQEAAEKLSLPADNVFKTLVVVDDSGTLAVALVPVNARLSEKKFARALGVKKIAMANSEAVTAATGYVLGGVSPLGQKKRLRTVINESANACEKIYVSAGRRGLEVAIAPHDLAKLINAHLADIAVYD